MRRARRATLTAAAIIATAGLMLPAVAAHAQVTEISDGARDPEFTLGAMGKAGQLFRFQDTGRVATARAAAVFSEYAPSGTSLGRVALLAASTEYADALAAAPLAETLSAPILLANANGSLSAAVAAELENYDTVVIVSGRAHIPDSTEKTLWDREVDTVRYAGSTRFDTAATVGLASLYWESVHANGGSAPAATLGDWSAYLADGLDFPDGLAAGPAAARETNGVVLLTSGSDLGGAASAALRGRFGQLRGVDEKVLEPLLSWWNAASSESEVVIRTVGARATDAATGARIGTEASFVGADRYETAALVATSGIERGLFINNFAIASGEDFPDAVVAGGYAGNIAAPLLLTRTATLSQSTADVIAPRIDNASLTVVFGGEGSVSREVSRQLIAMMTW